MLLGIDVSTYFEEEKEGAKYFIDGQEIDLLHAFRNNGVSLMRIRIWNQPYAEDGRPYLGGTCDVDNFIKLAKKAMTYGYRILIDFHYSDFWADPGRQLPPKAWAGLSFKEIEQNVYNFTKEVLLKAKAENIDIPFIQVGNEITNGMIWPYGKTYNDETGKMDYTGLATLLKAGFKAAREVYPSINRVVHLERSYDQDKYREYFDNITTLGVEFETIGLSFYPHWHGLPEMIFANIDMLIERYHKEIIIMELGYGFTLVDYLPDENGEESHLILNGNEEFVKRMPYPITKEGQKDFIELVLRESKKRNLTAVCYWEPCWIPIGRKICWASEAAEEYTGDVGKDTRNEWANQCLFDYQGNALPAFFSFKLGEEDD